VGGDKGECGGVNSSVIYLMHSKNLYKCHNNNKKKKEKERQ
jgi:hypothetical protein